ncbi:MAG: hypothetical protein R3310_04530 [Candidatus Competibacteraceae bacterium]|nr:hypothetical protein [Candidatus Competibacteraceae bacterium]
MPDFLEVLRLGLMVALPVLAVTAAFQAVVLLKLLDLPHGGRARALWCILLTALSAYLLSLPLWLLWPDPDNLLLRDTFSVPALLGEAMAMPFWLWRLGFVGRG